MTSVAVRQEPFFENHYTPRVQWAVQVVDLRAAAVDTVMGTGEQPFG